jgi:translation initiation factor IF-3
LVIVINGERMGSMSGPSTGDFVPQGPRGKERIDEPRINRRIRVPEIRVIGEDGEQLGIMPTIQALRRAESVNLDLVEVQPRAKPPVCKIMDYGKYKYEQSRKLAESKKKQQQIELKEVKFRPKTGDHDFDVKVKSLKRFLEKGNKGKVTVMFRGREIVHPDIGRDMLNRVIGALGEDALIEQTPRLEGRQMVMIVAPARGGVKKA